MVLIPEGEFLMGSNRKNNTEKQAQYGLIHPFYLNQHPERRVFVSAFFIDKYEVSNRDFKGFVLATGGLPPFAWTQNAYNVSEDKLKLAHTENLRLIARDYLQLDLDLRDLSREQLLVAILEARNAYSSLPVTQVSWVMADRFCRFHGKRLPTEAEWEKAARGIEGHLYSWGNEWRPDWLGLEGEGVYSGDFFAVENQPNDVSTFGVMGLSGNVMEWVESWYLPYPGSDYASDEFGNKNKVIKGGSIDIGHYSISEFFMSSHRAYLPPESTGNDLGFRCAASQKTE